MSKVWTALYNEARKRINSKDISPFIEYGNYSCAILSGENKIYCGVDIKSTTGINSSALKSAITSMFNNGNTHIEKIVILNELEELIKPTEDSIEYLLQLNSSPENIEILTDIENFKTIKLSEIIPDWWGTYRNKK